MLIENRKITTIRHELHIEKYMTTRAQLRYLYSYEPNFDLYLILARAIT